MPWDHQDQLPADAEPLNCIDDLPTWENNLTTTIRTTVPHTTIRDEHSDVSIKVLTLALLEEMLSQEAWIHRWVRNR